MVKHWFYNHGRKRNHRNKVNYIRKWSLKKVVGHIKKVEIQEICQEDTGCLPGTKGYISGYQKALASVVEELSPTEEAKLQALAEEWTQRSPPVELQRK
jgi:hypothetical protein